VAERLDLTDVSRELSALASGVPRRPPRVLAAAAILLPKTVRSRWLAEWTGELAALPTRRDRAGFVAGLTIAMPGLARTLRRTERSGRNYVLPAGAVAATLLDTGLTWPAAVVAVAALAVLAAVLFAGDGTAAKRLRALIEAWRRR
jgi:hypothetical protein